VADEEKKPESCSPGAVQLSHLLTGDFMTDLHAFMCARMERVDPGKASGEFARLEEKARSLYGEVKAALPGEVADRLNELCDAYSGMGAEVSDLYYRRGFSDGVMIVLQALMMSA